MLSMSTTDRQWVKYDCLSRSWISHGRRKWVKELSWVRQGDRQSDPNTPDNEDWKINAGREVVWWRREGSPLSLSFESIKCSVNRHNTTQRLSTHEWGRDSSETSIESLIKRRESGKGIYQEHTHWWWCQTQETEEERERERERERETRRLVSIELSERHSLESMYSLVLFCLALLPPVYSFSLTPS
jgi:hypothetical protein